MTIVFQPVNDASAVSASNHDSTYMELVTSYLPPPPTDTRRDEVCDGGTVSTLIVFMH